MYRDEVGAKPKKKEVLKHVVNRRRRHTRLLDLDVGRSNSSNNPTLKVMPSPFSHSYPPVRFRPPSCWCGCFGPLPIHEAPKVHGGEQERLTSKESNDPPPSVTVESPS